LKRLLEMDEKKDMNGATENVNPPVESVAAGAESATTAHRRVMIAVDGSEYADYAIRWTYENVFKPKDELMLVHVAVPPMVPDFGFSTAYVTESLWIDVLHQANETTRKTVERYHKIAKELTKNEKECKVRIISERGEPKDILAQIAKEQNVDLVVVGSRGFSTVKYIFLGSTSQYLVNHLEMPVIVVHKPKEVVHS